MLEAMFDKVTIGLSIIETWPKESRNAFIVTQGPGIGLQVPNRFNGVEANKNKVPSIIHSFIYPFILCTFIKHLLCARYCFQH